MQKLRLSNRLFLVLIGLILPMRAFSSSGTLIVLNKTDNTAMLIDLSTQKIRATIPTGAGPHELAVSPDGKWAVVCNYGWREPGSTLMVIDVAQAVKVRDIDLGEYRKPHGIAWRGRSSEVLVTSEENKALLIVDIDKAMIRQAIPLDQEMSHMVACRAKGDLAFVANINSGTVSVVDLKAGKVLRSIKTGNGAEGIAVAPNGKEVWVTNREANMISIIEIKKFNVVAELESTDFPLRVKFTPKGKFALVSNARSGEVAVFETKSRAEVHRLKMPLTGIDEQDQRFASGRFGKSPAPIGIIIPRDGKTAYVANANADRVVVIDLLKWEISGFIPAGKEPDGLGWSALP